MAHSTTTHHLFGRVVFGLLILSLVLFIGQSRAAYGDQHQSGPQYHEDQLVVKLAPGIDIEQINADYGTETIAALLNSSAIYLLQLPEGASAGTFVQEAGSDERLLYAELNYVGLAPEAQGVDIYGWPEGEADSPDDGGSTESDEEITLRELYDWEWGGYDDSRYYLQPAVNRVNLSQAHAINQGSGVVVAVLDTGVDLTHPLLAPHLTAARYDFIDDNDHPQDEGDGQDNNGNGQIDELVGHGTHVAGIIHLVAPQAQIMPLRVLNSDGQGSVFLVAEAILFAAKHGADVINLSMGTVHDSALLQEVIDEVTAQGVVVVGAAGNLNADIPQYPAAASCSLAVTALNPGLVKARFASYGEWVSVIGPGERIYSAYPGGGFAWWSGTSMATPFVAGQVALIRSMAPELTAEEIGQLIGGSAQPIDTSNPDYQGLLGAGLIDVAASLTYLDQGEWPANTPELLYNCGG